MNKYETPAIFSKRPKTVKMVSAGAVSAPQIRRSEARCFEAP
jgi:hypothetical protein